MLSAKNRKPRQQWAQVLENVTRSDQPHTLMKLLTGGRSEFDINRMNSCTQPATDQQSRLVEVG